jgi:hypothetical protein
MAETATKITFAETRYMGVCGVPIYCAGYQCSRSIAVMQWPDDLRLSDIEPRFICTACASAALMCGQISTGKRSRLR